MIYLVSKLLYVVINKYVVESTNKGHLNESIIKWFQQGGKPHVFHYIGIICL